LLRCSFGPEKLASELPAKQETVVRVRASALQHALLHCHYEMVAACSTFTRASMSRCIADKPSALHAKCLKVAAAAALKNGDAAAAAAAAVADAALEAESQPEDALAGPAGANDAEANAEANAEPTAEPTASAPACASSAPMYLKMLDLIRDAGVKDTDELPCGKVWAVVEAVRWCAANGEKLLIFSQFTKTLDGLEAALLKHLNWGPNEEYLRKTSSAVRHRRVTAFNAAFDKDGRSLPPHAFLLSTTAGGMGINLTRMILYDVCWNPSSSLQAVYRFYRYGQTRPTFAYRLVQATWPEDRIYGVASQKDELSLRVVDRREMARGAPPAADKPPPPPCAPNAAELAAWAASREDKLLQHLVQASSACEDGAASASLAADACGPWIAKLAKHADALQEDAALALSDARRSHAVETWIKKTALREGGKLTARDLRVIERARKRREAEPQAGGAAGAGPSAPPPAADAVDASPGRTAVKRLRDGGDSQERQRLRLPQPQLSPPLQACDDVVDLTSD
jgi:hypothetical protein